MEPRTRSILLWSGVAILMITGSVILILSFSGSKDNSNAVNEIYTNAALTISAQEQTLQAVSLSSTPNFALFFTPTPTVIGIPSLIFQTQTPVLLPTFTRTPGFATTGCDNSVYISDVTIPDGTTIAAGQNFTKTWKVSNTGTCAWTATYQIIFISGNSLGGKATAIGKIVNPGESADISVVLTSSSDLGALKGIWRLSNDRSQPFGTTLTVEIISGAATGTITPTPTKTSTPTPTSTFGGGAATNTFTPTPTPTPTNSATPTNTPTPTETPLPTPTI